MPAASESLLMRIRDEVALLPDVAMRAMRPVLAAAEREVASDLRRWLATHVENGADRFTAQKYRALLVQLREAQTGRSRTLGEASWLRGVRAGTEGALKGSARVSSSAAADHLTAQLDHFAARFGTPQAVALSRGSMMERGEHLLWPRYESSAARYAGQIGDDIRRQLAIGVTRNESMHEMGRRLVRLGGPKTARATLMTAAPEVVPAAEDMAAGLFTRYEHWADRLARTEVIHAYGTATQEGMEEANAEVERLGIPEMKLQKQWDAYYDRRLCAECRQMDGVIVDVGAKFPRVDVEFPPAHPCCFVGETLVSGTFEAGLRVWYDGEVVDLQTAGGHRLTITPNHPVLTQCGFIAAGALSEGMKVLADPGNVGGLAAEINENHAPLPIAEVFGALRMSAPCTRTTCAVDDLHGDARWTDRQVDVVGSTGELFRRAIPHELKPCSELRDKVSTASEQSHARLGALDAGVQRVLSTAPGIPCAGTLSFDCSAAVPNGCPLQHFRRAPTSDCDPCFLQSQGDGSSGDSSCVAERLERCTIDVASDDTIEVRHVPPAIQVRALVRVGRAANIDASLTKPAGQERAADSMFSADLLQRFSGQVVTDEIIKVRKRNFRGHVYDLQSPFGWILAQGIYTSNCRCTTVANAKGWT